MQGKKGTEHRGDIGGQRESLRGEEWEEERRGEERIEGREKRGERRRKSEGREERGEEKIKR